MSVKNVTQNVTQNLTTRQQQILALMQADNTLSAAAMAENLGVTVRTIRRDIEALRQTYPIQWVGAAKTGHWEFNK